MASVWYVGGADRRVIQSADWDEAGTDDTGDFSWDPSNGYSIPESSFTADQLAYLDSLDTEFWVGAPDGPRTVVVVDPAGYVTEARVRELIAQTPVSGLSANSVGLGQVDNTADVDKPVSAAQAAALALKLDRPPVDGTDGQVVIRDGSTTRWASPAVAGGQSSVAVTSATDTYWDSGTVYTVTGNGVAPVADSYWDSGTTYTVI